MRVPFNSTPSAMPILIFHLLKMYGLKLLTVYTKNKLKSRYDGTSLYYVLIFCDEKCILYG